MSVVSKCKLPIAVGRNNIRTGEPDDRLHYISTTYNVARKLGRPNGNNGAGNGNSDDRVSGSGGDSGNVWSSNGGGDNNGDNRSS